MQKAVRTKYVHDPKAFKVGDIVTVNYSCANLVVEGWENSWVASMDECVGKTGKVTAINGAVKRSGFEVSIEGLDTWVFPSCALLLDLLASSELIHNATAFIAGQRVFVAKKTVEVKDWTAAWVPTMDYYVGKWGVIESSDYSYGFSVRFPDDIKHYFPSCALQLTEEDTMNVDLNNTTQGSQTAPPQGSQTKALPAKKKRRVRVGPGPWDEAPCSHLRWNLMGFFRYQLALVKSKVSVPMADGRTFEVEVGQVEVACTKCNTRMTLKAK